MRGIDVRTALCEQHRRELLAEAERQRLLLSLPGHQRPGGRLARAVHAGWEIVRRRVGKQAPVSASGNEAGRYILVWYDPASDWDLNRRN